ncbi:zinc-binding dehydrogenase [uncultured Sphingomonas sp.]|uniref:MDR/zinc-dependent alcohol dehydrogenase-like family protein n=1 Tax=uncultured Sphingomonas sp. TaxID=158754 RepID=UPI0030F621BB
MPAAVLVAPGRFEVREAPVPQPGAGEVRVRLEGCGVCASNVEPWEGQPWSTYPSAAGGMGHEGWGVVDALGEGVTDFALGERATMLSGHSFAPYDVAAVDQLVRLPAALDGQAFPGEPLACAMNIFRRADVLPGQTMAIVGIGFLGAVLTKLASDAGARVIAISRREESLALARANGAAETIAMDDHWAIIGRVKQLTGEALCERVIEAVGKQWPLDLASAIVGFGGRLVVAGYHQDGPRQVNMQDWNWKGIDVINAHERDPRVNLRGLNEAVAAVAGGRVDLAALLTHRFTLTELNEAVAATRDKPAGFVKAVVTY